MDYQLLTFPFPKKPSDLLDIIPWTPIVDNHIIIGQPLILFEKGQFYKVPAIFGTVRNETLSFIYLAFQLLGLKHFNLYEYEAMLYAFFGKAVAEKVLQYYPGFGDARHAIILLTTDYLIDCPTRYVALRIAKSGTPIWVYHFEHPPVDDPDNNLTYCRGAVCHGAELVYVFHSISFCPGFYQTPAEQQLSWQMLTYWTSFAHGKVPLVDERKSNVPRMNGNVLRQEQHFHYAMVPRLIHWPQFNSTLYTLRLDIPVGVDIGYNRAKCDFWDTLGYDDQQKILV
jgi:carboxylesterase type B